MAKRMKRATVTAGKGNGWTMNRGTVSGCVVLVLPGGTCDLTGLKLSEPAPLVARLEGATWRERAALAWQVAGIIMRGRA